MAYNDHNIIKDAATQPVPQYFNAGAPGYEPVLGANGATRTMIYDAGGSPLFTSANPASVQLTGSNLKWTPLALINTGVGVAKSVVVPAGKEYWVKNIFLNFVTTSVVGNRTFQVIFDTGTSVNTFFDSLAPVVAANLNRKINYGMGHPKETIYDANNRAVYPLPDIVLQAGDRIIFGDAAAVDPTNDTLKYFVRVLQRSV